MYSPRLVWVCILVHVSVRAVVHSSAVNICQSGMNRYRKACYWVESSHASFAVAQESCAANGGNLATIDSAETSEFLKDFFDDIGVKGSFWIGYDERSQTWIDGTPFSWTNYNPGDPSSTAETCTALIVGIWHIDYAWADFGCPHTRGALCEIQLPSGGWQFNCVGVDQGSSVSVGDRRVVVQTNSSISCAIQCAGDADCSVFRYIEADKTCSMYNSGSVMKEVDNPAEWFLVNVFMV